MSVQQAPNVRELSELQGDGGSDVFSSTRHVKDTNQITMAEIASPTSKIPKDKSEPRTIDEKLDFVIDLLLVHESRLGVIEKSHLQLQMEADANRRNFIHLQETFEDLTGKLNEAKNTIANLTMNTVAKESFEREKESRKVFLRDIPKSRLKGFDKSKDFDKSVFEYIQGLSRRILTSFDERDIQHTRVLSRNNETFSVMVLFTSVSDAQKFKFRLSLKEDHNQPLRTRRMTSNHSTTKISIKEGLTFHQRTLLRKSIEYINNSERSDQHDSKLVLRDGYKIAKIQTKIRRRGIIWLDNPLLNWTEFVKPIPTDTIRLFEVTLRDPPNITVEGPPTLGDPVAVKCPPTVRDPPMNRK